MKKKGKGNQHNMLTEDSEKFTELTRVPSAVLAALSGLALILTILGQVFGLLSRF